MSFRSDLEENQRKLEEIKAELYALNGSLRAGRLVADPDADAFGRHFAFERAARSDLYDGVCRHTRAVPVESVVTGELLARLCPDCDEQLPADGLAWRSR